MKVWTPEEFRIVCAWCSSEIRAPKDPNAEEIPESHGVCVSCAVAMGMPLDRLPQEHCPAA